METLVTRNLGPGRRRCSKGSGSAFHLMIPVAGSAGGSVVDGAAHPATHSANNTHERSFISASIFRKVD